MALKPFMRWVGGKIWFTKHIDSLLPDFVTNCEPFEYGEPFLGGGSVFIHIQERYYPSICYINDLNPLVFNTWKNVQANPIKTVMALQQWKSKIDSYNLHEEKYHCWREMLDDVNNKWLQNNLNTPEFAAKIIFLTKICYKSSIEIQKDKIYASCSHKFCQYGLNYQTILDISNHILSKNNKLTNLDYKDYFKSIKFNNPAFVFLDPPYYKTRPKYIGQFTEKEYKELKTICDRLDNQGIKFMLTNSNTDFIKDLFKKYDQKELASLQRMQYNPNCRKREVKELIIRNY